MHNIKPVRLWKSKENVRGGNEKSIGLSFK